MAGAAGGCRGSGRFCKTLDPSTPVLPVGVGSNLIVRDGGVPGVVVRLPKAMAKVSVEDGRVRAGAGAMGITVASAARDTGIAGLELPARDPGDGRRCGADERGGLWARVSDILIEVTVVTRDGAVETWPAAKFGYVYRHSDLPAGRWWSRRYFRGDARRTGCIGAEMDRIAAEREARSRCVAAPAVRPSRIPKATRPGS